MTGAATVQLLVPPDLRAGCSLASSITVRDLLLQRPVFWIQDANYLVVAFMSTVLVFLLVRRLKLPTQLFLIPDAIGLALFTVSGTQIALDHQTHWLAASLLGVITGVLGGTAEWIFAFEDRISVTISAADALAFVLCRWTRGFARPARSLPQLGAYLQRMLARPAVQKVFAVEQPAMPAV